MLALAAAYPYVDVLLPTALKKLLSISFLGMLNYLGNPSTAPLINPNDEANFIMLFLYQSYNSLQQ